MARDIEQFDNLILDVHQLREHPCREPLLALINRAYYEGGQAVFSGKFSRFENVEELLGSMGDYGRCCVLFRKCSGQSVNGWDEPVATATLKPFKEDITGLPNIKSEPVNASGDIVADYNDNVKRNGHRAQSGISNGGEQNILSITDWEPASVAVRRDPSLLGKGLASRCLTYLEADLCSRIKQAELKVLKQKAGGVDLVLCKSDLLSLRLRTTWEINGEYWQRRGFMPVEVRRVPEGVWGAKVPFRLMTMTKRISCPK